MYQLNKSDLEDFNMLKNVHIMIYEVYEALYKLELNGKKSEIEYKNLLKRIEDLKKLEKSYCNRLFSSFDLIDAFKNKLIMEENDNIYAGYPLLYNPIGSKKEFLKFRIANTLSLSFQDLLINTPKDKIKLFDTGEKLPPEIIDTLRYIDLFSKNVLLDEIRISSSLFLSEDIPNLSEKILWSKYALSFSIPMFEDEFIKNEFNTPQNIIMYHRMVDGFFPNVAPIKLTANVVNPLNLSNALEKLMLTRNYYFYNPDQMLGIRFLACSIRASIVMLDDNEAKIIIDKINNAIKVLMNVKDTELIVKTLQNIIDSREADKEKLQIVTFRR